MSALKSAFKIEHRAALGDKKSSSFMGVSLEVLPEGHVLHALSRSADGGLSGAIRTALGVSEIAVRFVSPGQWFIVGDAALSAAELGAMTQKLGALGIDTVDQSHGRVRIGLSGEKATRVLNKGTAADLSLAAFPVGHATTTLIGHIGAHVTRTGEQSFELMVLRGFAESLWDELSEMCAEFA